ncbi:hypothetical protein D9M68_863210 [compost metagenome]
MRTTLLSQIKRRRMALGLRRIDMPARTGIVRQQYGRIEKSGNPNLDTLDKIAEGLDAILMLIPKELQSQVESLLANESSRGQPQLRGTFQPPSTASIHPSFDADDEIVDPWTLIEGPN